MRCACGISPFERGRNENETLREFPPAIGQAAEFGGFGAVPCLFFFGLRPELHAQKSRNGVAANLQAVDFWALFCFREDVF